MSADLAMARSRAQLLRALRSGLDARGYLEVETPIAVPFAGQEPHLRPFETCFRPDLPSSAGVDGARRLHLHTSPEYAMKRLLSKDHGRIWQIARVFRDGELSRSHNPEFTLLELYAAPGDAGTIMADLEQLVAEAARALRGSATAPPREGHGRGLKGPPLDLVPPFERLTCREAFQRHAGFDPIGLDPDALAQAARTVGVRPSPGSSWDDLFTRVLLERIEPALGLSRPTYLTEYPASQAALARLVPGDPRVAQRFELYAAGLELANGFGELNDAAEQRRRLEAEQRERARLHREVFPLDERFLSALPAVPDAGGVALGVDRLLMLLTGAKEIADVLSFPAAEEYPHARRA